MLFKDVLHEQLAGWLLGYFPYGGPDFGEIAQVARIVGDGGDDAFYDAWTLQAERRLEEAHTALQRGHPHSARAAFLSAACCYAKRLEPGWLLAPRAASLEPRLAGCIADPGRINVADGFRAAALQLGAHADEVRDLGDLPQPFLARMERLFMQDRVRRWSVINRGYWVHGVASLRDYLASLERYTLADSIKQIRCPTLVTLAADDPIAAGAEEFYGALACPKTLIRFSALDGAGGHCEMGNRSLLNRRVLDWLDEILVPDA